MPQPLNSGAPSRVAVIGGGYAGLTAAAELAAQGVVVTVFEAGKVLGGRARRVERAQLSAHSSPGKPAPLDNGQHLLIGAYQALRGQLRRFGVDEGQVLRRLPMRLQVEPDFVLACARWPAPLHLLSGLLSAKGLSWGERWALLWLIQRAKWQRWRLPVDQTVSEWLAQNRQPAQLISRFWTPLTLAALNTPLEIASAQVLLNVLRDSLGGRRAASDLLLPLVDFSALYAEPAAAYIQQKGGYVQLGHRVKVLRHDAAGWYLDGAAEPYQAVVVATAPHQAAKLLQDSQLPSVQTQAAQLASWPYQPIVTVYLQYTPAVRLAQPMLGLADSLAQWVFDRSDTHGCPGLIAVVISAQGVHSGMGHEELALAVQAELHQQLGLPDEVFSRQVITEKRATFACSVGLARPANRTAASGLYLAGDYTAGLAGPGRGEYPATLEGAVRSGLLAAQALLADRAAAGVAS
ncbi:hydroxysqualene dehydroxylase HpnE [Chitinibacter tainanensis]|uniref:hydroxysqualene dehydroxylase HpnE n=1 Tax=Chitinibacter tainanensis TaxID=230667 RepID=UPI0003FBFC76|nr:hydroxysqualene dehydroxylase HpnE [Chitinibacter tainanensis]